MALVLPGLQPAGARSKHLWDREILIRPAALQRVNARLLTVAQDRGVMRGEKLCTNGTVMETAIHYSTDSKLLDDSVRVLGHSLARARTLLRPPQADNPLQHEAKTL